MQLKHPDRGLAPSTRPGWDLRRGSHQIVSAIEAFSDVTDTNALIDVVHEVQGHLWVDKVIETRRTGRLYQWMSTFYPDRLLCLPDRTFHHGAFNAGMRIVSSESISWIKMSSDRAQGFATTTEYFQHVIKTGSSSFTSRTWLLVYIMLKTNMWCSRS